MTSSTRGDRILSQVSAGIRSGRPLAELKETVTLDRYKGWANYERLRRMNVEAAYLDLTTRSLRAQGALRTVEFEL